ncbi:hypothetical protein ILUMI_03879 [Ignelater luminosus]|uniref:Uncharacterized protein n=1 Tax=Ignelater luminosus TaxID=2038154 RepID=A0A8K0DDN0_IGNLU|nr:hypothetical protein ILUMI_03879 [Ignelater luminosus]
MASWSRSEIRAVLRYNFVRGLSIDQCLEEMTPALNNDCPHPSYSPELAPCDFALFHHVKMKLTGKRFSNDEDLLRAWSNECASFRMKRGRAGLRTGFDEWRSVLNVVKITFKEFNKQTSIAKLL